MIRKTHAAAVAALLAATALSTPALSQDVGDLVIFGDSLSDPGNIPGFTGGFDFPPAPYFDNHFSNGPTFAELLPGLLDLGAGDTLNFAVGGAFSGQLPTPDPMLEPAIGTTTGNLNTITQAPLMGNAALFGLDDTDILTQVGGYLAGSPTISSNTYFSVYGGANDYFLAAGAIALLDPMDAGFDATLDAIISGSVTTAVTNLGTAVGGLAAAGGENFIVPNLPNLGKTPANNGTLESEALGAIISEAHNGALASAMAGLAATTGADIYLVDVATLTADMQANPAKYGLANVTDACIDDLACVLGGASVQNTYQFWDSVHPTAAVHAVAAAFVRDTITAPRALGAQAETGSENAQDALRRLTSAYHAGRRAGADRAFVFGDWSHLINDRDGETDAFGHEYSGATLTGGVAVPFGERWLAGGAVGITRGSTEIATGYGGFDFDSVRVGGFLGYTAGWLSVHGAANVTQDQYDDITRNTGVVGQVAAGETTGDSWSASLEGRGDFGGSYFTLSPLARLRTSSTSVDGYAERGAPGLNLLVLDREIEPVDAEYGAEISGDAGFVNWWLEGVYVEALEDDDHIASSALVTVPNVIRNMDVMGTDGSFGRISGATSFNFSGFSLEFGGETITGSNNQDVWGAYGRLGKKF